MFARALRPEARLGLVLLFPVSAVLGEGLLRFTHHRPLGAATWTACTLILYLGLEFTLERSAVLSGPHRKRLERGLLALGLVLSAAIIGRALLLA